MEYGINTNPEKTTCANCKKEVTSKENFCSQCGNPLTFETIRLNEQRLIRAQLEVLSKVAENPTNNTILKIVEELRNK